MSTPPPLLPDNIVKYRSRTSAFDKEQLLRLENGQLVIVSEELPTELLPLAGLTEIRLRFFPTRFQRNRYECLLHWDHGRHLKICNQFFAGMADFKDQSGEYVRWVHELHRQSISANPNCHYFAGLSKLRYFINATFLVSIALLLIILMVLMASTLPAIAIIKLIIVACYLPILVQWLRRNKPRTYDPTAIPQVVLPGE